MGPHEFHRLCGVKRSVGLGRCEGRDDIWRLRYATREALLLFRWMYYASDVASLCGASDNVLSHFSSPARVRR